MHAKISILFVCAMCAGAAEIVLPSQALERDHSVTAVYRTNAQATGKGTLAVRWSDALGRVVEERTIPVELVDETEIRFPLDLTRAVAMVNEVRAHLSFQGTNKKGAPDRREEDAAVSFVARPPDRRWSDYVIFMWQTHSVERAARLKALGINAGQYGGKSKTPPEFLLKNDMRWYAENLATDFYSEYHRWRPDRVPHWSYLQAKELYRKDPTSKEAFKRHPSFSDPSWLKMIHDRLVECTRFLSPYRPVFYDLGDESGIADLAAYWDFDFSEQSLAEMREWLKERYGTLGALNRQWGKSFAAWQEVMPETTNEAMERGDDNFSAWADHKEWMDVSYARTLKFGADAIRSVDPDAYVAIAGAQMPGWGGYDYYRLTQVLQAMEPYDIGNNIEIIRSINPRIALITTAFARGAWEKHRIWYELLHGARGNIIWDEKSEHVAPGGTIGERGREVSPYYNELRRGLAALLMNSERLSDPVAIHYSQASMRTEWMLAQRPRGEAWVNRTSSTERRDSDFLRLRESYCRLIEDLGLQYNFVAYGQVEQGELTRRGYRVLILPRSSSLSAAEAAAIRDFAARGGVVITDGEPGTFDEHSRRLPESSLAGVRMARLNALDYHQQRLVRREGPTLAAAAALMRDAAVAPEFAVREVGVETHSFRNGGVRIVGLLSNPQLRVDELGPPEFRSNERFEKPQTVRLALPGEWYGYDVRNGKPLGRKKEVSLTLDPYEPAVLAFSATELPAFRLTAPGRIKRGDAAVINVRTASGSSADIHVFHIDVTPPDDKPASQYSGNVLANRGVAAKVWPVAVNDTPGKWTVRARDILTGREETAAVEIF